MSVPKILIVEDDPATRALLSSALQREGLFADTAVDGVDAIEKVRATRYEVMLVDLMMPRMNGIDFITAYAALPNIDAVVIIITAFDDAAVRRLAPHIAERVHAVIHKPFEMAWVVSVLRECAWARMRADPLRETGDDRVRPIALS